MSQCYCILLARSSLGCYPLGMKLTELIREAIRNLRAEAVEAGDEDMEECCGRALRGDPYDLSICLGKIADARAQS